MASKSVKVTPPATDLFQQIDDLFRNKKPVGRVSTWTLHRFLASDPNFAIVAKEFNGIWDEEMVAELWRTTLPFSPRAPRLKFVGPKKPPAPDTLVKRIADVEGWSYQEVQEALSLLYAMKTESLSTVASYYGVELE